MELPIIVGVEFEADTEQLTRASAEAIRAGASLTNGPIWAVSALSNPSVEGLSVAGVDLVFVREDAERMAAASAELIGAVIAEKGPVGAVFLPGTYWGKEAGAHLSAQLDAGVSVDVATVTLEDGELVASKSVLGGSWVTEFKMERGVPIVVLGGSARFPATREAAECQLVEMTFESRPEVLGVTVESAQRSQGDSAARLTEAEVAVIGGRGAEDDFNLVSELADKLGGAVGATRVACDEGWADRALQVGQTGVTIAPRVYVGVGVSGAIHHTCGMQGAEIIVAICDDPDAPIFEIADFGIVGDVNSVIPQALEALSS